MTPPFTQPLALPQPLEKVQIYVGRRAQTGMVLKVFHAERQIICKMESGPTLDPRGSFVVADQNQQGQWTFRNTLTPEQAGAPPLTMQQRAELQERINRAKAGQSNDKPQQ
jgi:hypothetical protein